MAQGQATISTATAAATAREVSATASHPAKVAIATTTTTGTKISATESANRWIFALPAWACVTNRTIWASCVSRPTRVARTTRRPPTLTVAPTTASPGPVSTGTLSPVNMLTSTAPDPRSTTPSVAIFSPARTTNRSPLRKTEAGICSSPPAGVSRIASFAPNSARPRSAELARLLAAFSHQRPASMNATTAAPTSKKKCAGAAAVFLCMPMSIVMDICTSARPPPPKNRT